MQVTIAIQILAKPTLSPNSYSVSSDPLEIGNELTMDYPLDNPFDLSHLSRINWCPALGF